MQILLACAKEMRSDTPVYPDLASHPAFISQAQQHIRQLHGFSQETIQKLLKCNEKLALINKLRYQQFFDPGQLQHAALAYFGVAYKSLKASEFTETDWRFAKEHLWITSFLYGLLRPTDLIKLYRLEGSVRLPDYEGKTLFDFWKPLLTDRLIDAVKADDGILMQLATEEMTHLFDWKRVRQSVRLIEPQFCVEKNGKLKVVTVYAKMCRGAMTQYIIQHQVADPRQLSAFEFEGYRFRSVEKDPTGAEKMYFMVE